MPGGRERRINEVNETLLTKMSLLETPRRGESEDFMYCRIHTYIALMTLSSSWRNIARAFPPKN